ncbi:hypothetical protein MAR_021690, partial [Mya arenaria]
VFVQSSSELNSGKGSRHHLQSMEGNPSSDFTCRLCLKRDPLVALNQEGLNAVPASPSTDSVRSMIASSPADQRNYIASSPADPRGGFPASPLESRNFVPHSPAGDQRSMMANSPIDQRIPADLRKVNATQQYDVRNIVPSSPADGHNMLVHSPADRRNMVAHSPAEQRTMMASSPIDQRLNNVGLLDQMTIQVPGDPHAIMVQSPVDHRGHNAISPADPRALVNNSVADQRSNAIQSIVADIQTFASQNSVEAISQPSAMPQMYRREEGQGFQMVHPRSMESHNSMARPVHPRSMESNNSMAGQVHPRSMESNNSMAGQVHPRSMESHNSMAGQSLYDIPGKPPPNPYATTPMSMAGPGPPIDNRNFVKPGLDGQGLTKPDTNYAINKLLNSPPLHSPPLQTSYYQQSYPAHAPPRYDMSGSKGPSGPVNYVNYNQPAADPSAKVEQILHNPRQTIHYGQPNQPGHLVPQNNHSQYQDTIPTPDLQQNQLKQKPPAPYQSPTNNSTVANPVPVSRATEQMQAVDMKELKTREPTVGTKKAVPLTGGSIDRSFESVESETEKCLSCQVCDQEIECEKLVEHLKTHPMIKCEKCDQVFIHKTEYVAHLMSKHRNELHNTADANIAKAMNKAADSGKEKVVSAVKEKKEKISQELQPAKKGNDSKKKESDKDSSVTVKKNSQQAEEFHAELNSDAVKHEETVCKISEVTHKTEVKAEVKDDKTELKVENEVKTEVKSESKTLDMKGPKPEIQPKTEESSVNNNTVKDELKPVKDEEVKYEKVKEKKSVTTTILNPLTGNLEEQTIEESDNEPGVSFDPAIFESDSKENSVEKEIGDNKEADVKSKSHRRKGTSPCNLCELVFLSEKNLDNHMKVYHDSQIKVYWKHDGEGLKFDLRTGRVGEAMSDHLLEIREINELLKQNGRPEIMHKTTPKKYRERSMSSKGVEKFEKKIVHGKRSEVSESEAVSTVTEEDKVKSDTSDEEYVPDEEEEEKSRKRQSGRVVKKVESEKHEESPPVKKRRSVRSRKETESVESDNESSTKEYIPRGTRSRDVKNDEKKKKSIDDSHSDIPATDKKSLKRNDKNSSSKQVGRRTDFTVTKSGNKLIMRRTGRVLRSSLERKISNPHIRKLALKRKLHVPLKATTRRLRGDDEKKGQVKMFEDEDGEFPEKCADCGTCQFSKRSYDEHCRIHSESFKKKRDLYIHTKVHQVENTNETNDLEVDTSEGPKDDESKETEDESMKQEIAKNNPDADTNETQPGCASKVSEKLKEKILRRNLQDGVGSKEEKESEDDRSSLLGKRKVVEDASTELVQRKRSRNSNVSDSAVAQTSSDKVISGETVDEDDESEVGNEKVRTDEVAIGNSSSQENSGCENNDKIGKNEDLDEILDDKRADTDSDDRKTPKSQVPFKKISAENALQKWRNKVKETLASQLELNANKKQEQIENPEITR